VANELTKAEVEKIVRDEMKKFLDKEFGNEMKKQLHNESGVARKELADIIRKALVEMNKFMWFRKDVWINNIK
jgi:hypothetical protein